ncbi:MAG TPA: ribose-phosphate pyrophosphokinase [Alphaproteobacteria bacterium]|nr:ribose-phosphate pyrophosphokinase [Alphaproteobacteria bacterium]
MTMIVFPMPGNEALGKNLAHDTGSQLGEVDVRRFPDGESYVRLLTPVHDRPVALVDTLAQPDSKILPLLFAAAAAKDLGATRVGLVAPYLAYMRQDRRFNPGEAVSSTHFGRLLSGWLDWLVTVDPHLHRHASLDEVYTIPNQVVQAAPLISEWIRKNVENPVLVGPDEESKQWVSRVAERAGAPYTVLHKIRHGDRDVEVSAPDVGRWRDHTPVLVDDIISTARTMIETIKGLQKLDLAAPVCVGVHAVFAGSAYEDLVAAGAARIVTCNTIPHASNLIDLTEPIVEAAVSLAPSPTP